MAKCYGFLFFALSILLFPKNLTACGYNFVGDGPTSLFFNINNTPDSFYVAWCSFGTQFDGLDLGTLQTLQLTKAKGATWESCQNNVTAMTFFYRIFPVGSPSGNFTNIAMPESYFTLDGPYTTRYRVKPLNINLLSGLTIGQNYTMEIYFMASVDTIGDDFIPETQIFETNSNQKFHLNFTPGGAAAPPISVVVTKDLDVKCAGDSTGIAEVTVFGGNPDNLFYTWSNGSGNFFGSYDLVPGIYTVTVTGAGGATQTNSITISAQSDLQNSMTNVQPVRCNGAPGSTTAVASGGVLPYDFQWNSGDFTETGHFPTVGNWWLTVTDAVGCSKEFFTQISAELPVQKQASATICAGDIYQIGGQNFSQPGNFTVNLPGANGACDTVLSLTINVLNKPTGQGSGQFEIKCGSVFYTVNLTASSPNSGVDFLWKSPSGWSATGSTATFQTSDIFEIDSIKLFISNNLGCSQQVPVVITSIKNTATPQVEMNALTSNCNGTWSGNLTISGGVPPYIINWNEPQIFGTAFTLQPGEYHLTVTGLNGCSIASNLALEKFDTLDFKLDLKKASSPNASDGSISILNLLGCSGGCNFQWSDGQTTQNASNLSPGFYCVTITNQQGCTATGCRDILIPTFEILENSPLALHPNPVFEKLTIDLPEVFSGKFLVKILDAAGREVFAQSFENQKVALDLAVGKLAAGVFQVLIFDGKNVRFGRFVKL